MAITTYTYDAKGNATATTKPYVDPGPMKAGKIDTNTPAGKALNQSIVDPSANTAGKIATVPAPATPGPVNTTQPSPKTVAVNAPASPAPIPPPTPAPTTNVGGAQTPSPAPIPQNQSMADKYKAGLASAKATGQPAPNTQGGAAPTINQTTQDSGQNDNAAVATEILAQNKAHQQQIDDYTKSQSSKEQTKSLTQTYKTLSNQLGIPELDTELMNMKNVIDGTEDDIRNEITKAGGFATNSQVLAMTDARNKTIIQNYNQLLTTRDNAYKNLTTMLDLTEKDRAAAQQKIDSQLNYDKQNVEYADKAVTNAQNVYTSIQKSEGWDGIYKAALASGDPTAIARVNSIMGGGFDLATMATQDAKDRATQAAKDNATLASQAETMRHNKATEAQAANKPSNDILAPSQADVSKVMSAMEKTDKATRDTIDTTKLRTDPSYFYWIKGQLGQ